MKQLLIVSGSLLVSYIKSFISCNVNLVFLSSQREARAVESQQSLPKQYEP